MADLLTFENLGNLLMLCFLQAVLGFDNLLYISIESQRAPVAQQRAVRFWGIIVAVALRVILLFVMISLLDSLTDPFFVFNWEGVLTGGVNFATLVFVLGGIFIIYTAVKEISHMLAVDHLDTDVEAKSGKSALTVVMLIVFMNLIFSFDSVLSALAITDVFPVLAIAIILSGLAMLVLADGVTRFLEKNRMYEVLGLFILLIVGVVLLGEAGQAAAHAMHDDTLALRFFGYEVVPMSKTTFYFSVIVLFAVEIIQSGYARKLNAERRAGGGH
ncbi:TerC family protein [Pseudooceanicola aestuarii]|uniref:TerC family protein n=1 Tax=Pseudooceanicola aestuarii TaxID=2697319 RepID=UPI0013D460E8|nr:tellurium resistance protein TerC [Pseudooceanicola aestuarii]